MKKFNIKYIVLYMEPNFADLNYLYCDMEGLDRDDVKKKFDNANPHFLISEIKEII